MWLLVKRARFPLLASMLIAATCQAASAVPAALVNKLKSLAGLDSRDCGVVALHESPEAAVACATSANSSGKAYRLAVEFQGTDSIAWQGAVRDEQGKLRVLYYDSDPAGGSGAGTTLSVVLCREILFAAKGNDVIECKPVIGEP